MLNFNGETGPYVQYTYVRTNSVLKKVGYMPKLEEIDFTKLVNKEEQTILKLIYSFTSVLQQAVDKNEPSIISKFLIDLSKAYSSFYNENKIITEDKKESDARIYLTYMVNVLLKNTAKLLGIQMPDKM